MAIWFLLSKIRERQGERRNHPCLPIAMGRGTACGGGALRAMRRHGTLRKGSPIPRCAGTSPLRWGSKAGGATTESRHSERSEESERIEQILRLRRLRGSAQDDTHQTITLLRTISRHPLATGHWPPVTGHRSLVTGHWPFLIPQTPLSTLLSLTLHSNIRRWPR